MDNIISMDNLKVGKKAYVFLINVGGGERRRLLDLGLIEGTKVEAVQKSPSGDPIAYLIRGAVIALRAEDAKCIKMKY